MPHSDFCKQKSCKNRVRKSHNPDIIGVAANVAERKGFEPLYFTIISRFCKGITVFLLRLQVITAYKTVELRTCFFLLLVGYVSVYISCHSDC